MHFLFAGREEEGWKMYGCIVVGLIASMLIGQITESFTSYSYYPTQSIADASVTGPATVIFQGLGIGMISCVFPVVVVVATIHIYNALTDEYGVGWR
jgi:inorganic pyrophosphatase